MGPGDKMSQRQLMTMIFMGLLSPMIRFIPGTPARIAGTASWLSPVAAVIPALAYIVLIWAFLKNRRPGEGMGDMFSRSIGKAAGKAVSVVFALWMIVYGGFALRAAAERLVSSVYGYGSVAFFAVITLLTALVAGAGTARSLGRTAEALMPVMIIVLGVVLFFALFDINADNLAPVSIEDTGNIMLGGLNIVNFTGLTAYFTFMAGHVDRTPGELKRYIKWILVILAVAFLLQLIIIGTLSPAVSVELPHPFFIMIRNLKIFSVVERMESLVVAVWIFTDFIFLASMMMSSGEVFRGVFGAEKRTPFVWPVAALTLICAAVISPDAFELYTQSRTYILWINAALTWGVIPVVFIIGKLRKTI